MYALYDSQGICRGKFNTREAALRSVPKDQQRCCDALIPERQRYCDDCA